MSFFTKQKEEASDEFEQIAQDAEHEQRVEKIEREFDKIITPNLDLLRDLVRDKYLLYTTERKIVNNQIVESPVFKITTRQRNVAPMQINYCPFTGADLSLVDPEDMESK